METACKLDRAYSCTGAVVGPLDDGEHCSIGIDAEARKEIMVPSVSRCTAGMHAPWKGLVSSKTKKNGHCLFARQLAILHTLLVALLSNG